MNRLYPNFLRKIDHYLKINHPHVWRTRVHDFGWFSLILGNGLAVCLGMLVVGQNNILSERSIIQMHFGLAVILAFVGLFWVMKLLQFKIKSPNFKTMLTTWLIYIFCVGSLGLNLATFTSAIAYRTAHLYSDEVVEADYDYLNRHQGEYYNKPYKMGAFSDIMVRYDYQHSKSNEYGYQINDIKNKIRILKDAKGFVREPLLINYRFSSDPDKYIKQHSMYNGILVMHWIVLGMSLFYLPTLFFLGSCFGLRNVLISVFSTGVLVWLTKMLFNVFHSNAYYIEEGLPEIYAGITFFLAFVLVAGRDSLKIWNYVVGVFMLMLGVVFFNFSKTFINPNSDSPFLEMLKILPVSLLIFLVIAWVVVRHNERPVVQISSE